MREGSIRGLRAFCAVARHLSFKTAAEELCVTPSAVSHQIKALEQRLQASLFERRARDLVLTKLGAELRAEVEPLLRELDNVTARFEQRAGWRRVLRIGVTPFFASELLVPRLHTFTDRHHTLDIRVETSEAGALPAAGCDAAILLLTTPPDDWIAYPLFSLRLLPVCAPQLAKEVSLREPRDLLGVTLIAHQHRPRAWQEWFARMGLGSARPLKLIQLDSIFAIARAAERGLGVALLPAALSEGWFATGALVPACVGELPTNERYYFVHRPETAGNPDVGALRDWAVAAFAFDAQRPPPAATSSATPLRAAND